MDDLWSSLSVAWRGCIEEAWTAYRSGSLPIGAVVLDASGGIVSRGRNRIHERSGEPNTLFGHKLSHAEINALVTFDYHRHDISTSMLYTTTEPCPLCVGAARMADVGGVRFAARDPWAGSAAMFESVPYLKRGGTDVRGPSNELLEDALVAVQIEYWLRTRPGIVKGFVATYEQTLPHATSAGRTLHENDTLQTLASRNAEPSAMLNTVAGLITST